MARDYSHAPPVRPSPFPRGMRTDVVRYRNVPGVSLYFLSLARLRSLIGRSGYFPAKGVVPSANGKVKLSPAGDLIVGSTARTGVGFILMPFTLLKTLSEASLPPLPLDARLTSMTQASVSNPASASNGGAFTALSTLYKTGGLKALWRGSIPTALRDAPGAGLFIVFYERGRRFMGTNGELGGGAVGGGMAGTSPSPHLLLH